MIISSIVKKYAIMALIPIVIVAGYKLYNVGYDSAVLDYEKARLKAESELKEKYDKIIARKSRERTSALKLVAQLRKSKSEKISREISKVNNTTDCKHLGPKFTSVFNDLVGSPPGSSKSVK